MRKFKVKLFFFKRNLEYFDNKRCLSGCIASRGKCVFNSDGSPICECKQDLYFANNCLYRKKNFLKIFRKYSQYRTKEQQFTI